MHDQGEPPSNAAPDTAPPSSGLLSDIAQLGRAVKHLFGAQLHLLAAELGLARSAVSWMLMAGLAATVAGVGLGLTALGLLGVILAAWLGSWLWSLLALALLQCVFLIGAILVFRRCMHWMSMPASRHEWSALMHDAVRKAESDIAADAAAAANGEGDQT